VESEPGVLNKLGFCTLVLLLPVLVTQELPWIVWFIALIVLPLWALDWEFRGVWIKEKIKVETTFQMQVVVSIDNLDPTQDHDMVKDIIVEALNGESVMLECEEQGIELTKVELVPREEWDLDV